MEGLITFSDDLEDLETGWPVIYKRVDLFDKPNVGWVGNGMLKLLSLPMARQFQNLSPVGLQMPLTLS